MKKLSLFILFALAPILLLKAQTKITFNVNLKPQLEDSVFIDGKDQIQLIGNLFPLGNGRPIRMKDTEPIDSIYTAEVNFSSRLNNQQLEYNFRIVTESGIQNERMKRSITLQGRNANLPPLFFNAFVW